MKIDKEYRKKYKISKRFFLLAKMTRANDWVIRKSPGTILYKCTSRWRAYTRKLTLDIFE